MGIVALIALLTVACAAPSHVTRDQSVVLVDSAGDDRAPSWSPNGKMLVFESNRDGDWDIYVSDSSGLAERSVTQNAYSDRYPSWSPSGTRIVFIRSRAGVSELVAIRLSDSQETLLLSSSSSVFLYPHWSPGGREIAFTRQVGDTFHLEVLTLGSGSRDLIAAQSSHRDLWPRWTPDGRRVVFFSRREPHVDDDEIYIFDREEEQVTRLTTRSGHDFSPTWSPTARHVAIAMVGSTTGPVIAVIDLHGKIQTTFGHGFDAVTEPSWHPTANAIAFAGRSDGGYAIYVFRSRRLRLAATQQLSRPGFGPAAELP